MNDELLDKYREKKKDNPYVIVNYSKVGDIETTEIKSSKTSPEMAYLSGLAAGVFITIAAGIILFMR